MWGMKRRTEYLVPLLLDVKNTGTYKVYSSYRVYIHLANPARLKRVDSTDQIPTVCCWMLGIVWNTATVVYHLDKYGDATHVGDTDVDEKEAANLSLAFS